MRLAYFTPLPPSKSRIADYNSELLPHLAKGAEISVFVADADELRGNRGREGFSVHDANDFDEIRARRPFDLCVYHLGHGLMQFDAEWRSDIMSGPKRESVTLR